MRLNRRLLLVGGVLVCAIVLAGGVVIVSDLYVDSKVPVTLGYKSMVTQVGNNFVQATGTWTREGVTEGSKMGFPLQTSRIICIRDQGQCIEARAEISFGDQLYADLSFYEVDSWSDTTIVFRNDSPCGVEIFTIDRKTESVNGIGHPKKNPEMGCKWVDKSDWHFHLDDGFKVWWELRQKARPLPLRLVHALFGN